MSTFEGITTDWTSFQSDLTAAESKHNEYLKVLRDLTKQQENSSKTVKHLTYIFSQIQQDIKKPYLTVILGGNLNVSLLNPDDRYKYKEDYERFKATVTYVIIAMLTIAFFFPYRAIDALCNFLMVWYYCTLTIREAILRVNGSRIKGWWLVHHYIACVLCGITLTWRDRACYKDFRPLFLVVSFYICALQIMQCKYQTGCLRRLHALGQRYAMDVTLEGFSSWMFKGLTFLLPFLIIGYLIQGYCSYYLFCMYYQKDCSEDWQVLALAILFAVISCGNLFTILSVFFRKLAQIKSSDLTHLASKYRPKLD
ncbi:hypothetical protein M3Y98_00330300 [Aphelenchoides besseyi]|nr:hypothetical protein M3Y98_00330300 [Aphelenchoides besseyi]KAI6201509.1 hypothetical protein M3Y96_00849700 [Aphelenchoides besseyi]